MLRSLSDLSRSSVGGKKKKLYRPPPVLTKYEPPTPREQPDKGSKNISNIFCTKKSGELQLISDLLK
jgi:hypothetical protein